MNLNFNMTNIRTIYSRWRALNTEAFAFKAVAFVLAICLILQRWRLHKQRRSTHTNHKTITTNKPYEK